VFYDSSRPMGVDPWAAFLRRVILIYLLKRIEPEGNPEHAYYPTGTMGMVVRADSEQQARDLACISERDDYGNLPHYRDQIYQWLDPKKTTCEEVSAGEPKILLYDYIAE